MAKAADFNGDANETDVIPPEKCRGKGRPSILSEKAYLWLLTINNPQDHGISLDQKDILERLKDDIAAGKIVYMIARMQRIVFACDEVAELLDRTGADKERKELLAQIEARLALIARQGRAFGIHLILATQRPDANILSGQIKNNMNIRICGRADTTLSTIIIGDGRAAEQIPHDAQGRFLMEDGTVFQAYYFNGDAILK